MEAVTFKNVKKQLGDFKLNIPKLEIKKGYITGFVGENGSGKTTTIKLIMDMLIPNEGVIEVLGMSPREQGAVIKEEIGYVGDPVGYPEESKLKDIKNMTAPFYLSWDETLFERYSVTFKLDTNKKYKDLSTGQKKQFALIMALAHRPKLILLDEPTANLDPVVRNEILEMLMEHMQSEEVTVFYSTHITSDLEKAADYIIYIKEGQIVIDEEKEQLASEYCIVKGPKNIFGSEVKKYLLGYKQTSFGAEALVKSKRLAEELFGREVKYVSPNIEDIVIFLSDRRGVEYDE